MLNENGYQYQIQTKTYIKVDTKIKKYENVKYLNNKLSMIEEIMKKYDETFTERKIYEILKDNMSRFMFDDIDIDILMHDANVYFQKLRLSDINRLNMILGNEVRCYLEINTRQITATLLKMTSDEIREIIKTFVKKGEHLNIKLYDIETPTENPVAVVLKTFTEMLIDSISDEDDISLVTDIEKFNNHLVNKQIVNYVNEINAMPDYDYPVADENDDD